jgi:hypothetical protein
VGGTDHDCPAGQQPGAVRSAGAGGDGILSYPQVTPNEAGRLVFAWTQADDAPIIFGQMKFFLEFDVCFYRSQAMFDVHHKNSG